MTIDQLITQLKELREKYGGECYVCKSIDSGLKTRMRYVDCVDVCDAVPVFRKGETLSATFKFRHWTSANKGTPADQVRVVLFM